MVLNSRERLLLALCTLLTLFACSKKNDNNDDNNTVTSAGSMVAAVFSSDQGLRVAEPSYTMCSELSGEGDKSDDGAGANAEMSGKPAPGTYGADDDNIELSKTHFCLLEDGTENPDTDGPDGKGRFATFEIAADITMTCSDGTKTEMGKGSSGVARNTEKHTPEVYGSFTIGADDVTCTMRMNEDGSVDEASCNDKDGKAIKIDSEVTCATSA